MELTLLLEFFLLILLVARNLPIGLLSDPENWLNSHVDLDTNFHMSYKTAILFYRLYIGYLSLNTFLVFRRCYFNQLELRSENEKSVTN